MFSHLSDRQKKIMLALAAAGGLALVTLMARNSSGGTVAADTTTDAGTFNASQPPVGSTFADNGAAAGDLSTQVTQGLSDVGSSLDYLSTNLPDAVAQAVAAQLPATEPIQPQTTTPSSPAETAAVVAAAVTSAIAATPSGAARTNGQVAGAARGTASPATPIHLDSHGAKAGLRFVTVDRGGVTTRLYETKRGKGDFGATRGSVVSLGKPAAKALPSFKSIIARTAPKSPVKPKPTPKPKQKSKKR